MANKKISAATALNTTGLLYTPVAKDSVTTDFKRVDQISPSSAPGVGDDDADGYHAGSLWYKVDTGELFICRSAGTGAAVWSKFNPAAMNHYIAGNYYQFPQIPSSNNVNLATAVQDSVKAMPFRLQSRLTISHLTSRIGTQNGNWAFAIYNSHASTGLPTTVRGSCGAVAVPASGATREVALDSAVQIEPGVTYWAAINFSGSTATTTACGIGGLALLVGGQLDGSIGGTGQCNIGINYNTQTCGTWNDLTSVSPSGVVLNNAMHMIGFKVSAVP